MKKDKLSTNFIFQVFYQAIMLVVPLFVAPILTRRLQDTALGTYTFTNSIVSYFILFASLGISKHGQRAIARNCDDTEALSRTFWGLYALHLITSISALLIYIVCVFTIFKDNSTIYLIQSIYVASSIFDVTWYFYGIEKFKTVVLKNMIVKIIETLCIIVFIRQPEDLWKYCLIVSCGIFFGNIVLMPEVIKVCKPVKINKVDIVQHIKPILVFFVSSVAVSLYSVFDKTLLGIMTTTENVAYYEYANKIIGIPRSLILVIGTIMLPRACSLANKGDITGQKKYISISYLFVSFIGMATVFGLMAIANDFSIIYFGNQFAACGGIMIALSPIIYVIGIGEVVRTQYMIPNNLDIFFTASIILGAIINILLSILFIPLFDVYGAVIGTLSAEIIGALFQIFISRQFVSPKEIISNLLPFAFIGFIMYICIGLVKTYLDVSVVSLIIQICTGIFIYCGATILYIYLFKKSIWIMLADKLKPQRR